MATESDAALLTTVYYAAFTVTRTLAAPLSAVLSSRKTLWWSMAGSLLSLLLMLLVIPFGDKVVWVLWVGAALFGAFEGPLWPAMLSLISEEYGLELRATQTALVLVMAKGGIAAEQMVFSSLLSSEKTAPYFIPLLIVPAPGNLDVIQIRPFALFLGLFTTRYSCDICITGVGTDGD